MVFLQTANSELRNQKEANMTWSDFYLICFAVGFLFSLLSFIMGGLHLHGHWPHAHGIQFGHGGAPSHPSPGMHVVKGWGISPFNFFTIAVFLAWFGGTGYLLSRYSTFVFALGLLLSTLVGLIGASIVFFFLARVLANPEANMDQADYEMVGVVGRVSSPIREGGTGEIIFSQAGSRRCCAARSDTGAALPKESEVAVARYERGIAYVRPWDEFTGEGSESQASQDGSEPRVSSH
jgi:membrane protein implicated in regulation of membrane protease activity